MYPNVPNFDPPLFFRHGGRDAVTENQGFSPDFPPLPTNFFMNRETLTGNFQESSSRQPWGLNVNLTACDRAFNVSPVKNAVNVMVAATFAVALMLFAGCKTAPSQKTSTIAPPAQETSAIELFNGTNFDGWTFVMKNNADPMATWSVTNGVIHCTGKPTGYARTVKTYHDYQLTVVWRFVKVAPHADNSGILINIRLPDVIFPRNVQCQGKYQHQGDLILERGASAEGYPSSPKDVTIPQNGPSNEKPVGEWNTDVIVDHGPDINLFVNGKLMNQIIGCNLTFGYIGIQSEGGEIEIRKLTLVPDNSGNSGLIFL